MTTSPKKPIKEATYRPRFLSGLMGRLILSFAGVALLVVVIGGISVWFSLRSLRSEAIREAELTAKILALAIGRDDESKPVPTIFQDQQNLQDFISDFHRVEGRDMEVIDLNRRIIADVVPQAVGDLFEGDVNDAVGQTLKDGKTRTFVEISEDYPEGIQQLVVPLRKEATGEIIGVVVFEYTPLYEDLLTSGRSSILMILIASLIGIALAAVIGYRTSRSISVPLTKLREAALRIRHGDLETKIELGQADEIGDLASAFSAMTNNLKETILAMQNEIADRKEAEEAVRQSEKRFRALIENSADAITLLDATGISVYDSPAAPGMLGYAPSELIGENIFKLLHPDDLASIQPQFQTLALTPGARSNNIFRLRHHNGSWRWIESVVTNLLAEPSVQAIVANYRDITERRQVEQDIRSRTDDLATLYEFSRALANANDLDEVLDLVNHLTVKSLHTTFARIALLEGDEFVMRSAYPVRVLDRDLQIESRQSIAAMPYCQRALEQNEPVILRAGDAEVSGEERIALLLDLAQTVCLIPLRVHEFAANSSRMLGLLMVGEARNEEREPFTAEKLRLARSIGDQAALAIDKARLFNDLQRSNIDLSLAYDATIAGWSAALDLRDKETEGHTLRVTEMTLRLAKGMGFSAQELIHVQRGALLHDIGKMGVPDRILLKPDKLTDEEWAVMRMHPIYAYQMLKPIAYLGPALDIPYCHHEKWDGTGYPQKLKGDEIPFSARIFAVVDVYDALTSDRPYRAGWSQEKTLEHIRSSSGSHFDPEVVQAFMKMIETEK